MIAEQTDLLDALRMREGGQRVALAHADPDWKAEVRAAICYLASLGIEFSSDDVRELAPPVPEGRSSNAIGALVNAAAQAGEIRFLGFTRSKLPQGHGNRIGRWTGARPAA